MVIQEGYKQTEIGVIPKEWEICDLSDAVDFLDGQRRPIKSSDRTKISGTYPYYGASGIIDYVDDYIFNDDLILLGEDGENILSRNLPLAFQVKGKIWVNNHAHVLKPKETFDIIFLTNYLESLNYSLLNSGTAQPKLNKNSCLKIKIKKPTHAEQTAIATALSDTDGLITGLEKLLAKKRNIKQGAMQQLLQPKDGWEVKKLGECLLKNPDYGINAAAVEYNDNLPTYLRITDISENGKYLTTNKASVDNILSNSYYLEEGDIVFARTGASVGKTYLYNKNDGALVFAGFLIRVKANPEMLDYNYLFFLTQTKSYWDWVKANSMRSGQPGLNSNEFKSFEIPFPPKEEQTRIATILSDMDAELSALEQKLEKYKKIKLGMMQELLTGKTRLV